MKIDLQKDAKKILKYLKQRVRDFDPQTNAGPGDGETVHQIDIGFDHEHWGFVAVVFDTRPNAAPDGEWNSFIEETSLAMPKWHEAGESLYEGKTVDFILHDGTARKLSESPDEEDYAALFGDMLKDVLSGARDDGVFGELPTAEKCSIGIEEQDGRYGWPIYEDREKPGTTL